MVIVLVLRRVGLDVVERGGPIVRVVLVVLVVECVGGGKVIVRGVSVVEVVLTVSRAVVGGGGGGGRSRSVPVVLDERQSSPSSQSSPEQLDAADIPQPGLRAQVGEPLHQLRGGVGLGQGQECEQGDLEM